MRQKIKIIIDSVLAGCAISLGGIANICSQNKIVGSLFFTVGLFLVLIGSLNLFTGKVCYALDNKPSYIFDLLLILIGNAVGCIICGFALRYCYFQNFTFNVALKLESDILSVLVKAIFCNVCIYIGVNGYKKYEEQWKKILSLFFGVSVFVLCGFEHCVADIFYISYCDAWSWNSILFVLEVIAGNIIGGLLIPSINKIKIKLDNKKMLD